MNLMIWLCVSGFYTGTSLASVSESVQDLFRGRELVITGVVCNSKMQAAIISDEICKVGDTVQGYTVIAISKYCVELKKGEKLVSKRMVLLN